MAFASLNFNTITSPRSKKTKGSTTLSQLAEYGYILNDPILRELFGLWPLDFVEMEHTIQSAINDVVVLMASDQLEESHARFLLTLLSEKLIEAKIRRMVESLPFSEALNPYCP